MGLSEDLERAAAAAAPHARDDERVTGVLAAEPEAGVRVYLCAFERPDGGRAWLGLDDAGQPVASRLLVRHAASIAALCEVAEETSGGGDLEDLRAQLLQLRLTENPPGLDEADEAALTLESVIGRPPRVASPHYLDAVGAATRRLEQALGAEGVSPFAEAMKQAIAAVEQLADEVERAYKLELGA